MKRGYPSREELELVLLADGVAAWHWIFTPERYAWSWSMNSALPAGHLFLAKAVTAIRHSPLLGDWHSSITIVATSVSLLAAMLLLTLFSSINVRKVCSLSSCQCGNSAFRGQVCTQPAYKALLPTRNIFPPSCNQYVIFLNNFPWRKPWRVLTTWQRCFPSLLGLAKPTADSTCISFLVFLWLANGWLQFTQKMFLQTLVEAPQAGQPSLSNAQVTCLQVHGQINWARPLEILGY